MNDEQFEGWLDGSLDADEARDVAADSALGAQRALQARIDASLRARFAAPSADELARFAVVASANAWPWKRERQTWLALAATLLIAFGIGTFGRGPRDEAPRSVARWMQDAYLSAAPISVLDGCLDLEAAWLRSKLQSSALACTTWAANETPQAHTCVVEGESPTTGTPFTSCLRALVDGKRVLLWSAPIASDPKPSISPACGFVAYRGELDGRVLYEYSPLREPVLLREIGAVLAP